MKVGDKIIAIDECVMYNTNEPSLTIGKEYEVIKIVGNEFYIKDDIPQEYSFPFLQFDEFFEMKDNSKETTTPKHYDNTNGSLYLFAEQHKLNAWEFDIIKRIVRCRKKGNFIEDLHKTIEVIKLYENEIQPLNK
jgi:hypothetical protein